MSDQKLDKRYTPQELELIRTSFKERDDLLILFRRFLLQDEMTTEELEQVMKLGENKMMFGVLKKTLNPPLDKKAPINQTVDLFTGMDLQPTEISHAILAIKARKRAYDYLSQQFDALEGNLVDNPIQFDEMVDPTGKSDEEAYVDFVARNFLAGYIETQGLRQLLILASMDETPAERSERLRKNSNK